MLYIGLDSDTVPSVFGDVLGAEITLKITRGHR